MKFEFTIIGSFVFSLAILRRMYHCHCHCYPWKQATSATHVGFPGGSWLFASWVLKGTWLRQYVWSMQFLLQAPAPAATEARGLMVSILSMEGGPCLLLHLKFLRHRDEAVVCFSYWRRKKAKCLPCFLFNTRFFLLPRGQAQ